MGGQNNLKIRGSARVSQRHSSANKVQPNFNAFWKFLRLENLAGFYGGLIFGPGIFGGFVGSPRVFWGGFVESPKDFLGF